MTLNFGVFYGSQGGCCLKVFRGFFSQSCPSHIFRITIRCRRVKTNSQLVAFTRPRASLDVASKLASLEYTPSAGQELRTNRALAKDFMLVDQTAQITTINTAMLQNIAHLLAKDPMQLSKVLLQ